MVYSLIISDTSEYLVEYLEYLVDLDCYMLFW